MTQTATPTIAKPRSGEWQCWPGAEALLVGWIDQLLSASPAVLDFVVRLERLTSSHIMDWLDYIEVAESAESESQSAVVAELESAGFVREDAPCPEGTAGYWHPSAQFPRVLVKIDWARAREGEDASGREGEAARGRPAVTPIALAVKCDNVVDALLANGIHHPIQGEPLSPFRQTVLVRQMIMPTDKDSATRAASLPIELRAVQRYGYRGYVPVPWSDEQVAVLLRAREMWATRQRHFDDDAVGMQQTLSTARAMAELAGPDAAAALAFAVERDYWQRRNRAGQLQKARQDRVGLGWGNQDHHTFRSSRSHFTMLVAVLEALGFVCRERFYAGREAGWGAQILEQPNAGLVVFADVDLSPEEVLVDFSHQPLAERDRLGTIGLWTGLHGESMLQAGMHHLEAQFNFDVLRNDLAAEGVETMKPFSDLEHLRQAFTIGQRWPVSAERVRRLTSKGLITLDEADRFRAEGAVGSHLENLQRKHGFKGFNQSGINEIIRATDPRHA